MNTPKLVFFQCEQDIILSQSKYTVTSFIDFGPYKNIFSVLLTYTGKLQQELHKYASMKSYTLHEDTPITPEEKRRITSYNVIWREYSAECELIVTIINTSRL